MTSEPPKTHDLDRLIAEDQVDLRVELHGLPKESLGVNRAARSRYSHHQTACPHWKGVY